MTKRSTIAACVAAAGLAAPAMAQDSVSNLPGAFIGDAQIPWEADSQCSQFIVDLSPITTSGGTVFGVAPILKSSKAATAFFSSLTSAQTVSATDIVVDQFSGDFWFWDFPGGGVNFFDAGAGVPNIAGQLITPEAEGDIYQFAAGFGEFATTDTMTSYNGSVGGVVQFDKDNPSRLYVSRVMAAMNGSALDENNGAFGMGTVDANGNLYFRADGFNGTGPSVMSGDNIYRVSLTGRDCDIVNAISDGGAADGAASERLVNNDPFRHSVPGNIPADVNGRPIYVGLNFNSEMVSETAAGSVSGTTMHNLGTSQRGNVGTYKADILAAGGTSTVGFISKNGGAPADSIGLVSLDANGALVAGSQRLMVLPGAPIMDSFDGHTLSSNGEYDHYHSQVPTNGGNGQVALGRDAQGNALFAGVVYLSGSGNQDPLNAIVVGRFDPAAPGNVQYSLGGYVDAGAGPNGAVGKPVYDDMGNVIGQMRPYFELDINTFGPAMSGVAFDGAGNVWFTAVVDFPDPKTGESFLRTTLLRGVYQPNLPGGGFGFRLEKVLAFGDIIDSANTGLQYRLNGFQLVDNNSVSSGTFWSSNVKQCTWGNVDPSEFETNDDPRSTAGVVVATSITYDVDMDGDFTLNTKVDPDTIDEAYNVLMYVSNMDKPDVPNDCPADFNNDGAVNGGDLAILLAAWGTPGADLNGDMVTNGADLAILLAAWGPC